MKHDIGKFTVKSGKVVIGDPYHSHLVDANINIFNIKKGRWNIRTITSDDNILSELIILHNTINLNLDEYDFFWEIITDTIEIDSGILGIFDATTFHKRSSLPNKLKNVNTIEDDEWLNYCVNKVFSPPYISKITYGIVTKIDGVSDFYKVLCTTNASDEIIGIKIPVICDYTEIEYI